MVTALTAQNTLGVTAVHFAPPDIIAAQIDAVFSDLAIAAVKTGMLGGEEGVVTVAAGLKRWASALPVVVDPVMISTTGSRLLEKGAEKAITERLIPLARLLTPNLHEAAALLDAPLARSRDEVEDQAKRLLALGPKAVLIKGGHSADAHATDVFFDGSEFHAYSAPRIATKNTHGTGCTLASAVAAFL